MKLRLTMFLVVVVIASCSKDTFSSKPTLKLKETIGNYIPLDPDGMVNYAVRVVMEYTDAEGDVANVPLFIRKISSSAPDDQCPFNSGAEPFFTDSTKWTLPGDIPASKDQKGELVITISEDFGLVKPISCNGNDKEEDATYKFWFKDQAGNVSDTVTVGPIKIQKPG